MVRDIFAMLSKRTTYLRIFQLQFFIFHSLLVLRSSGECNMRRSSASILRSIEKPF